MAWSGLSHNNRPISLVTCSPLLWPEPLSIIRLIRRYHGQLLNGLHTHIGASVVACSRISVAFRRPQLNRPWIEASKGKSMDSRQTERVRRSPSFVLQAMNSCRFTARELEAGHFRTAVNKKLLLSDSLSFTFLFQFKTCWAGHMMLASFLSYLHGWPFVKYHMSGQGAWLSKRLVNLSLVKGQITWVAAGCVWDFMRIGQDSQRIYDPHGSERK